MKFTLLLIAAASLSLAQTQEKKEVRTFEWTTSSSSGAAQGQGQANVIIRRSGAPNGPVVTEDIVGAPGNFIYMGGPTALSIARVSVNPVKGAPYSAETSTETVQTLADGNRISSKQTGRLYRDSEGRTRTENTIAPLGNWVPEGANTTLINIDDPTTGSHITLNTSDKTAHKVITSTRRFQSSTHPSAGAVSISSGPAVIHMEHIATAEPASANISVRSTAKVVEGHPIADNRTTKTEDLGKRVIEGVECTGTRTTFTIPAGQIGNERPLDNITERWYSEDLKMDILRTHTDPRSGVVTYKVSSIIRGEQPRSLFEAPADVKIETLDDNTMKRHMEEVIVKAKEKTINKKDE